MKTNVRNGKIARLSRTIRNELNQRLAGGEMGTKLVRWLNGLPEVKEVLDEHFEGKPVSEQNLSEWKAGGFAEWLAKQEVLEQARGLAEQAEDWHEAVGATASLGEQLSAVLTVRYAGVLAEWKGEVTEGLTKQLRLLHVMAHDVARLARVGLERQRVDARREKSQRELVDLFMKWVELPKVSEAVRGKYADPVDRERIVGQVFGRIHPGDEDKDIEEILEEIRLKNEVCRCRRACQCLKEGEKGQKGPIKPKREAAKSDHPSPSIPAERRPRIPVEGRGKPERAEFIGDPVANAAGRERWMKDPTSCDEHGEDKEMTLEERRRAIRNVYGMPEPEEDEQQRPNAGLAKETKFSEGAEDCGQDEAVNPIRDNDAPGRETGAPEGGEIRPNQTGSNPIKPTGAKFQVPKSKVQGKGKETGAVGPRPADSSTPFYWTKEGADQLERELAAEDDPKQRAIELRQWREEEERRQWRKENNIV